MNPAPTVIRILLCFILNSIHRLVRMCALVSVIEDHALSASSYFAAASDKVQNTQGLRALQLSTAKYDLSNGFDIIHFQNNASEWFCMVMDIFSSTRFHKCLYIMSMAMGVIRLCLIR